MSGSRPPLERLHRIVAMLNTTHPIHFYVVATELEVSRKTIQRDVEFMRDRLGVPLAASREGVMLTERVRICPICARALGRD